MTQLPKDASYFLSDKYAVSLFHGCGLDFGLILLAFRHNQEIHWDMLRKDMVDPFVWYDWETGNATNLQGMECRQPTISPNMLQSWFVRVFPAQECF